MGIPNAKYIPIKHLMVLSTFARHSVLRLFFFVQDVCWATLSEYMFEMIGLFRGVYCKRAPGS